MKKDKLFIISSFLIIFIFFGLLISGRVLYQININKVNEIGFNFEELYPFDKDVDEIENEQVVSEEHKDSRIVSILKTFNGLGDEFVSLMVGKDEISKAGFVINNFLSDTSYTSNYVKLNNGYWIQKENLESDEKIENLSNNYLSLKNYLEENGIDFLYVQTPIKECKEDNELPFDINTYGNENIDKFLKKLDENNVKYIDLREVIHNNNMNHYDMFYVTDHHWKSETGLWVADVIEEKLNIELSSKIGEYENKCYEGAMFGSYGKALTHVIATSEDFNVLYPKFETNFNIKAIDKGIDKTGSFKEIFVDEEELLRMMENDGGYAYETLALGNRPLIEIKNLNKTEGLKVLIIRDSFCIGVTPYLALSCKELSLIDTRVNQGNFNGSIINYIDKYQPDVVIALQSFPQSLKLNK